jgi:hypothetical protein
VQGACALQGAECAGDADIQGMVEGSDGAAQQFKSGQRHLLAGRQYSRGEG